MISNPSCLRCDFDVITSDRGPRQQERDFAMRESEVPIQSDATNKVLTVRTIEDNRAQLEVLALLSERSVAEETCVALEDWVERSK